MKRNQVQRVLLLISCGMILTACGQGTAEVSEVTEAAESAIVDAPEVKEADQTESVSTESEPTGELAAAEDPALIDVGINTISMHYYNDSIYVDTAWDNGVLSDEAAKKYPQLQTAFEEYDSYLAERMDEMQGTLIETAGNLKEDSTGDEYSYIDLSDNLTAEIARADTNVVSLLYEENTVWGGPHPRQEFRGQNYDTKTGEELTLEDVITDTSAFFDVVREKLETEYADVLQGFYSLDDSFATLKNLKECNFLVGYEGVTLFFNADDLGPYAIGSQVVTIYYDEQPELFIEKYTKVPDSYIIPVLDHGIETYDLDGDGSRDRFSINNTEQTAGDYAQWYDWEIVRNEEKLVISHYDFSKDAYLMKANDQYYLYLIGYSEGDMGLLNVIDLKEMSHDEERTMYVDFGAYVGTYVDLPEGYLSKYETTVTGKVNPEAFFLSDRIDMLGTYSGYQTYRVGEDGYPVTTDKWYNANMTTALWARRDISCEYVDLEGNRIGEGVLPQDSYAVVLRTDNSSWVDVVVVPEENVDNSEAGDYDRYNIRTLPNRNDYTDFLRIYTEVDEDEYFHLIDGSPEDDVLAGIQYAG